jgi:hypothetical protein
MKNAGLINCVFLFPKENGMMGNIYSMCNTNVRSNWSFSYFIFVNFGPDYS